MDRASGLGRAPARRSARGDDVAVPRGDLCGARRRREQLSEPHRAVHRQLGRVLRRRPRAARLALGIPGMFVRFGLEAMWPATTFANWRFQQSRAKALFAGCAGHSVLPLDKMFTAALGLIFSIAGHVEPWPVAAGGSEAIPRALGSLLRKLGGEVRTGVRVTSPAELPAARVYLFDTSPDQLSSIAQSVLPSALPPPPRPLSLRPWGVQARLGARRTRSRGETPTV